jgi:hypothetical protein
MDDDDLALRNLTYALFVDLGRAPTAAEVAGAAVLREAQVQACWERLHGAHALVLDPAGVDTVRGRDAGERVRHPDPAGGRWWFGNCAWDAFGICAALHQDGRIETVCADCRQPVRIAVRDQRPDDDSLLFHCLVPAARWWDDITFT